MAKKVLKVYCAGGQGSKPMLGHVLFDFVEDTSVYAITKAMKVMFDKYGNRRQRTKSKLKFLWDKLGQEDFLEKFHVEYDVLLKDKSLELKLPELKDESQVKAGVVAEDAKDEAAFELWKTRFVTEQKQEGLCSIMVPLQLGDIDGDEAGVIADALEPFGENILRLSVDQNMHFRNIPQEFLGNIFNIIGSMHSLSQEPALFGNMVACTGADTCKLGICLPRGVTPSIQDILRDSDLDLDALSNVKIHISGCPNTWGCHHVADLGFFGKVMKQGKDMMPGYNVLAGAITKDGSARFSLKVDEISAKDLPQFIRQFLAVYVEKKDKFETFAAYIDAEGQDDIKKVCDNFRTLPSLMDDKSYYHDWGSDEQFSLLKGQKAECSAGMFDMIDVDNALIKEALAQYAAAEDDAARKDTLYRMIFSSARMLLVTRGIECKSDEEVFENFIQHFIKTDLVPATFTDIVLKAKDKDAEALLAGQETVNTLATTMRELYKSMDDSLRFRDKSGHILGEAENVLGNANELTEKKEDPSSAERFKDLRGVGCPMNFVKVKIELSTMKSGEKIAVLLDDGAPVENVPGSVRNEGHEVVTLEQQGSHWMLVIKKA